MTLRPIPVLLILVRWPTRLVATAAMTAMTAMAASAATAMTTVTAVAEQMHSDERREYQHPDPVL
jgi:hypothetical protein